MTHVIAGVIAVVSFAAYAQTPTTPTFDVASVKLVVPPLPSGAGPWTVTHGRFKADTGWVRGVIAWAYNILAAQVQGGPGWIDSDFYEFFAKSDREDAGPEQVRIMLRTLLADRFKLAVHRQTREGHIYTLVIGKNGSKMDESKDGRRNYINWTGAGRVTFTEMHMIGLVNILSNTLGSPVVDKTGLDGFYNFKLEYADPRLTRAGAQQESLPDIFTAVQEQLGLKLESTKGPVEMLVIDHVERPDEN